MVMTIMEGYQDKYARSCKEKKAAFHVHLVYWNRYSSSFLRKDLRGDEESRK